eukprot:GHRR01011350.1.p2 GENE.GHRR01011350.1~~GHRR01011350.1.p2  ORF type:complete len:104 (+),score=27.87 GHRR01011350.1:709-1020(+)
MAIMSVLLSRQAQLAHTCCVGLYNLQQGAVYQAFGRPTWVLQLPMQLAASGKLQNRLLIQCCAHCDAGQGYVEALTPEQQHQAFLSRLLLMLGSFVIMCLLLF